MSSFHFMEIFITFRTLYEMFVQNLQVFFEKIFACNMSFAIFER